MRTSHIAMMCTCENSGWRGFQGAPDSAHAAAAGRVPGHEHAQHNSQVSALRVLEGPSTLKCVLPPGLTACRQLMELEMGFASLVLASRHSLQWLEVEVSHVPQLRLPYWARLTALSGLQLLFPDTSISPPGWSA